MTTYDFIERHKVIAIYRKLYGEPVIKLAQALCDGGVCLMESTFDQQDPDCNRKTPENISRLCEKFGDKMQIGAGTVLTVEQVRAAKDAGAKFIISPNTNVDVIKCTKELGLVSIPGAMTPSEIMTAHDSGADFVKLFPAGYLGFSYIKDIMAPISHVKLIATGGVTEESLEKYLAMGFAGAGVSSRLTDHKLIDSGNYGELTARARRFVEIVEAAAGK